MAAMIGFEGVSVAYGGQHGLRDVTLGIAEGELCVLVGPSGAGKSTLLRLVNRLVAPTAGRVLVDGQDIALQDPVQLRRSIGYAIQSVGLFPHRTVAENVATVPRLLGWPSSKIAARTRELLGLLRLDEALLGRYPATLSGGQAQRVGLARALAADPALLLMDEPFGAVDPIVRRALRQELRQIHARTGKTILLVTHDAEEALELATLLVVMRDGQVAAAGPPLALTGADADPLVRELLGGGALPLRRLELVTVAAAMAAAPPPDGAPTIPPDASLTQALSLMLEQRTDRLTVQEDREVLGSIGVEQLLQAGRPARAAE
jgi:osmoprotectant transport system ATP-binding protein